MSGRFLAVLTFHEETFLAGQAVHRDAKNLFFSAVSEGRLVFVWFSSLLFGSVSDLLPLFAKCGGFRGMLESG